MKNVALLLEERAAEATVNEDCRLYSRYIVTAVDAETRQAIPLCNAQAGSKVAALRLWLEIVAPPLRALGYATPSTLGELLATYGNADWRPLPLRYDKRAHRANVNQ